MWECGLKFARSGARRSASRHSLCGSVDWNRSFWWGLPLLLSHSLCGSVDWNFVKAMPFNAQCESLPVWECGLKWSEYSCTTQGQRCHSLCGSVDWNCKRLSMLVIIRCHSLCGSVDWNWVLSDCLPLLLCHSLCGSVDWNYHSGTGAYDIRRHSLCGSVDWNTVQKLNLARI